MLRDIENLDCSPEFHRLNFEHTLYTHPQNGQEYPACRMTRDGFSFLAMGFTCKKAAAWKERFLEAFNAMEAAQLEQKHREQTLFARGATQDILEPRNDKPELFRSIRISSLDSLKVLFTLWDGIANYKLQWRSW